MKIINFLKQYNYRIASNCLHQAYIIWENNESMSGLISIQFIRHAILGALNYNLIFYKNQIAESKKTKIVKRIQKITLVGSVS